MQTIERLSLGKKLFFEVVHGVVVTDVFDNFAYKLDIAWVLAFLNQVAEHVAKYATEVLVTCVGKEATAVS